VLANVAQGDEERSVYAPFDFAKELIARVVCIVAFSGRQVQFFERFFVVS
jgi:hypothetical protein